MPTYPANVSTVTVTGRWVFSSGSTAVPTGRVTFAPNVQLKDSGTSQIIEVEPLTVTLDGTGAISVVLMATDDSHLSPSGWQYNITEAINGRAVITYSMPFPAVQSVVDLASKAPSATPPALVAYALDTTVVHIAQTETITGAKTFSAAPVLALPALAVIRDVTGAITTYTEAGQPTTVTRDALGRVMTLTRLGTTLTVTRDTAGRLTGVS